MSMRCPTCGFENQLGMRFCGQCRGLLTLSPTIEERKLVTVLFADIVGSTRLLSTVDPEQVRIQIIRFFSIAQEEIHRYGGTVEKFIGDAVMAVFGLPTVHEDDVERAVRAAVSIRSRVRSDDETGTLPELRIGINTGEVVVSATVTGFGESLVTGEMVNLAVRLQQHGEPGQILVGESTYAPTRSAFEYRRLPQFRVKGKQEPLVGYECLGPRSEPLVRQGLPQGISSPLVGRHSQLNALTACIDGLRAGRGGIVSVIGEAGLGKSRLVAEVRRQVASWNLCWLEGRALSSGREISYRPFLEIIRGSAGITEEDSVIESWAKLKERANALFPDQVAEIVPYVGTLLGLEATAEWQERVKYLDGEAMGRQIYRSSRLFFEKLAQERPLVLAFEDLHWIDQSSAELLEHLFPLTDTVPLLLCGLGRPDPQTPAARLRDIAARDHADRYTEILLAPLSPLESAQLVRNLLGIDDLPRRFQEMMLEKTEGNPFFVEEIVRVLIDMKVVVQDRATSRWQIISQIEEILIPNTLRGVIMARVDRLEEQAKEVLKTASVIGRSFFYGVLRAVSEDGDALDSALAELRRLEFIREKRQVPELEYIFKHALIQEATYESILLRRRRELHRRVGVAIEKLFSNRLDEFHSLLSFHYALAEDWGKAQDYLFKAGDQAAKVAADAEALAHYRQALTAYSRVFGDRWEPLKRAALERKMGEALFRRGAHQQAMEHFQRALVYLRSPFPASPWTVRVEIVKRLCQQMGHRMLPGLFLRHADDHSRPAAEERTRIYEGMGWIDYFVGVDRVFLEALMLLNVAERNHLPLGISRGSMGLGFICDLVPVYWLARMYHSRAIALAEQIQHPLALGLAYLGSGFHELHCRGRWEESLEHFRRSATAYRQAGELRQWGAAATMIAWVSRLRGDLVHSLAISQEVTEVGRDAADPEVWGWGLATQGAILLRTGMADDAVALLQQSIELFKGVPDYLWVVVAMSNLGMCRLRQGKVKEALITLEESNRLVAERGFRARDRTPPLIPVAEAYLLLAEQGETHERRGWLRKAQRACRAALKQSRMDAEALPGANRVHGTYQWLKGRPTSAHAWWLRSLKVSERLGARYDLGLAYLEMGRRMGRREHLERARAIFTEIGARWDLGEVQQSLKKTS